MPTACEELARTGLSVSSLSPSREDVSPLGPALPASPPPWLHSLVQLKDPSFSTPAKPAYNDDEVVHDWEDHRVQPPVVIIPRRV